MSVAELIFDIDCEYFAGEEIAMTITFWGNRGLPLEARCSGRVLRAVAAEGKWHVAASIDRFTFSQPSSF